MLYYWCKQHQFFRNFYENPANKTLNVIKDVTQLKCSFTQNIIQDNDIFYVVPVQYYLNYEFRMIFIPRTIFSKPDRLVSPVIQCQLVNKNVFIAKNFNPNLSHPVFDQNYQDHKDCQQTTKDYYSIQPKTELDKKSVMVNDCIVFNPQSFETFMKKHNMLANDFIFGTYDFNGKDLNEVVKALKHNLAFLSFCRIMESLVENKEILILVDMNLG